MNASATPIEPGGEPRVDPLIGQQVAGRYVIHRALARGGMGMVYQGLHVELGRPVAIKVLSKTYAEDEEAVRRFQREARTASKLDHPNIVSVLDLGRLEDGEPFLVMELLDGEDLADLIARSGPMAPAKVLELLRPVASALDAVHAEGLLHRDIKPANVFLARRADGSVVPKLLDFGLSALREAPDHERLTREGIVVGTPHYVSPEAAEGLEVDERTDVYSLGLVAYEMLSGVLPLDKEGAMSLLYAKVRRPAPTLSERTGKGFPPALERLVARTLSRTPDKRPASAGAFIRELEQVVAELPPDATEIDLPAVSAPEREDETREERMVPSATSMQLPIERRGRWVIGFVLLALVAGGLGAWLAYDAGEEVVARPLPRREPPPRPEAPDPEPAPASAGDEPAPPPSPVALPSGVDAPAEPRPSPPRARAARQSETAPARHAPAPTAAQPEEPAEQPEEPAPQRPRASETRDTQRAAQLSREAGSALLRGQFPRARQLFRQATYADPSHAPAWRGLGLASEQMGMTPEAASAYRRYLALAPRASDAAQVRARLARLGRSE